MGTIQDIQTLEDIQAVHHTGMEADVEFIQ